MGGKLLGARLRDRRFTGYKFRRQHSRQLLPGLFCLEAALNIELDGSQHGSPDQRNTMWNGKSFWNRAASRRFGSGIRICDGTPIFSRDTGFQRIAESRAASLAPIYKGDEGRDGKERLVEGSPSSPAFSPGRRRVERRACEQTETALHGRFLGGQGIEARPHPGLLPREKEGGWPGS